MLWWKKKKISEKFARFIYYHFQEIINNVFLLNSVYFLHFWTLIYCEPCIIIGNIELISFCLRCNKTSKETQINWKKCEKKSVCVQMKFGFFSAQLVLAYCSWIFVFVTAVAAAAANNSNWKMLIRISDEIAKATNNSLYVEIIMMIAIIITSKHVKRQTKN